MSRRNSIVPVLRITMGKQIQTQIQSQNVSPQEALGLLEMAKDQLLNNLRKGTKNLVDMQKFGKK